MIGVYRITNLVNNKKYIGQSKNISQRWKRHTSALADFSDETIIRRAFAKYGLREQVSQPGTYGKFLFEVIEECKPELLLEREYFYMQREAPEYNIMGMPPNELLTFDVTRQKHSGSYFVQYHNYDEEQHYPGVSEESGHYPIMDVAHYISTRKQIAAYMDGAIIYLILGISIRRKKHYFLWSKTIVDEMEFFEDTWLPYNVIGDQDFFKPICLNKLLGFREFQKKLGNFAFGLSPANDTSFLEHCIKSQRIIWWDRR